MADSVLSVTMLGMDKLKKALAESSKFANDEMAKALNKAANEARQEAVKNAPHKTGRLWGSVHTEYASANNLVAKVGTKLEYARAQEYGTQGMQINSHSRKGKAFSYIGNITPKFYMRTAKQTVKPKLSNYLQEASRRIVNRIASGN